MERKHFLHCHIAGFSYYDGPLAFKELQIGTPIMLEAEPANPYDTNAVKVMCGKHKLGYLPRNCNKDISLLLQMGYSHIFEAYVQRLDPTQEPEDQVGIIVYVVKKDVNN